MIELKNVSYSYEKQVALRNINLTIQEKEAVAFMGANGCGKSTLLKILNGILSPVCGSYCFDGEEVTAKKLQQPEFAKSLHQQIGFVFQNSDTQLFCSNVYDEIAFGPRQMGLPEEEIARRVENCLSLLGLEEYVERVPYHLSGGEKRKVAIACVMSMNPKVIILDEPMNGLDPKTQRWLVEFFQQLNLAGKTLIFSTHNLEVVHEISQRIILFSENHEIAADMQTEKLLEQTDLLQEVNLVDKYYHSHGIGHHKHYWDHKCEE